MKIGEFLREPEPLWCHLNGGLPEFPLGRKNTALLIVDMQRSGAAVGVGGKWRVAAESGVERDLEYYNTRLTTVIPNLSRLLATFRSKRMEVIHGVTRSYKRDGSDRMRPSAVKPQRWPRSAWWNAEEEERIIPELEPLPNEIVVAKTATSFFGLTPIDRVLVNLGIENLVVGGTITNQCVESTVRAASGFGYNVVLVEDACATHTEELHKSSLRAMGDWVCKVRTTEEVVQELHALM